MDSHDDDLNLSDVVQPRTEAERLELEEAVARYRAERAEATERDNVRYLPSARPRNLGPTKSVRSSQV